MGLIRILCRPEIAPGVRLAGLPVDEAADGAAAATMLQRLADDPRAGTSVILVEEQLHRALPGELRQRLDRRAIPVIAPFPSPAWDVRGQAEEYVMEILRHAIGYRVRAR